MRKLKVALTLLFAMSFSLFLFACGGANTSGVRTVTVETEAAKTAYAETATADDFSTDGIVVKVIYKENMEKDENGKPIPVVLTKDQYTVDASLVQWGTVGTYTVYITPNDQKKNDPSIQKEVSGSYQISINHAFGAPVDGLESCSVCGAQRETHVINDHVVSVGWGSRQEISATEGAPYGRIPEAEAYVTYGTIGMGQNVKITFTVTDADTSAAWNTPLMGIRSGELGVIPREDNWVISTGPDPDTSDANAPFSRPITDGVANVGLATVDSAEWDVFNEDGTTWHASDTVGKTIVIEWNYREDGIMEIRHTLDPNGADEKVIYYTVKVPLKAYEIVAYGEKCTFDVTEVVFQRNLVLQNFELVTAPAKLDYAEHNMFDLTGLVMKATYNKGVTMEIDSYDILADIVTGDSTATYNLRTTPLTADMTNFRIEFGGMTVKLEGDNAVTVIESVINGATYNYNFTIGEVAFFGEDTVYTYDVNASNEITITVDGKANKLDAAQKAALDTDKEYYIAFRLVGVAGAAFESATTKAAGAVVSYANGGINVILPVDANTEDFTVVLNTEEVINIAIADTFAAVPAVGSTVSGEATIDEGGRITVTYTGDIPADTSKITFDLGTRLNIAYDQMATATSGSSLKVVGLTNEGGVLAVTYELGAPNIANSFVTQFAVAMKIDGAVVAEETIGYSFKVSENYEENGFYKLYADQEVYAIVTRNNLYIVSLFTTGNISSALHSNVTLNIENELATAYNVSVRINGSGEAAFVNYNKLSAAKGSNVAYSGIGTANNASDFDTGCAIVAKIDVSALGIRTSNATASQVYHFEAIGASNGTTATIYTVADAITAETVTIADYATVELQKSGCVADGISAYKYDYTTGDEATAASFYFAVTVTKATGAHVFGDAVDGVAICETCGAEQITIESDGVEYSYVLLPVEYGTPVQNGDTSDAWWDLVAHSSTMTGDAVLRYNFVSNDNWKNTVIQIISANADGTDAFGTFELFGNNGPWAGDPWTANMTATIYKNGEVVDAYPNTDAANGGSDVLTGDVEVIFVRLGSKLMATAACGDWYIVYNLTDALVANTVTINLAGNPYFISDIVVTTASVASDKPVNIEVGDPNSASPYSGLAPAWTSTIEKGSKVVMSGTMKVTAAGVGNWNTALMYLYSGEAPTVAYRADWWINHLAQDSDNDLASIPIPGGEFIAKKTVGPNWDTFQGVIAECDVTITFDWSNEDLIVLSISGTNAAGTFTMTYEITSATGAFADSYNIGLGCDGSYTHITSYVVTYA